MANFRTAGEKREPGERAWMGRGKGGQHVGEGRG